MRSSSELLRAQYTVEFPDSFFAFWDFANEVGARGIALGDGPLDIRLSRAFDALKPDLDLRAFDPIRQSRYRLDLPEFFTMLHGETDGLHWGYYLDDPGDPSFLVAAYYHGDSFEIWPAGHDLLEALRAQLEQAHRDAWEYLEYDPAHAGVYEDRLGQLETIRDVLAPYESDRTTEQGAEYLAKYAVRRDMTASTRDGMGIVVPEDTYQPAERDARFEDGSYLPSAEEVRAYLTDGWDAMKEGHPGTALKVGKDLWVFPEHVEQAAALCDAAYAALGRPFLRSMLTQALELRALRASN
jgi:hypothetical protein